jgi:hypothetical protein
MMLARKLPYFNTKTLTLNLANLELGEGFRDFPFILFWSSFYLYINFWFYDMQWGEIKTCCEKGVNKNMLDERERAVNGGRRAENKIWDNYWFILLPRASHFRSMSKTVSIPKDLCCRCDWRTYRSWCGILDLLKGRDLVLKGIGLAQRKKNLMRNALEHFSLDDTTSLLE